MAAGEGVRGGGGALALLATLLDRSVEELGHHGADARVRDCDAVYRAADVWDNNTYPLVTAALARTRWGRERRARRAVRWMADFGAGRQAWMRGHAAAAGLRLDPRWLPPQEGRGPDVDYAGRPTAPGGELTADHLADLAAAYDLAGAQVRAFRAERYGDRLDAKVRLALRRTYPVAAPAVPESPAALFLGFEAVAAARFDARDVSGVVLRLEPGGAVLRIGGRGEVRADVCFFGLLDTWWAQSPAGRRTAAALPARRPRPPRGVREPYYGYLGRSAQAAVTVLHDGMVLARQVRNHPHAHRIPLAALHRAFAGAGTDLVAAAAQPTPRRRDTAFRALVETWVRRGGPALDAFFTETLRDRLRRPDLLAAERAAYEPEPSPDIAPGEPLPPEAELRCAWYRAAYTEYGFRHEATALVHLAVPPPGPGGWRLRGVQASDPAEFAVSTEAFAGPARATVEERECAAASGALHVRAPDGWHTAPY